MTHRTTQSALFATLPPEWPDSLLPTIRQRVAESGRKLVVLDDDPTGTQTVYDIPVLTQWGVDVLRAELENDLPAFYVLTNSRSLPAEEAAARNAEIGHNLMAAARATGRDFAVVSRSDSTLRGHYPAEVDALMDALYGDTSTAVDATLIIPFFLEGGRYTVNDVHYVAEGDELIPAAETPFAQDAAFGYRASNLRDWVVEKTNGRISRDRITSISVEKIREGGATEVAQHLTALTNGAVCVVNSASLRDQEVFVLGLLEAESQHKTFVYRTAASFVQARLGLPTRPLLTAADLADPADAEGATGGLIVVGSHVPKSTRQLEALLARSGATGANATGIEVNVPALLRDADRPGEIARVADFVASALGAGDDAVIYTSRTLQTGRDAPSSLAIGQRVSASLVEIVQSLAVRPRYVLAKGGITSSDVATAGLGVERAMVLGQILPGVPVWRLGTESRFPDLPYIVFPGNVGDDDAVAQVVDSLRPDRGR